MKKLIKELNKRNWDFEVVDNTLHLILGNKEYFVSTEKECEELLNEIIVFW